MTSEIVIINKEVIVMAADSAVTIADNRIYTGVNKLFKLSDNPPMGIMIYGSSDFENIPLESLIKEYSKKSKSKNLKDIIEIKEDFLNFFANVTLNSNEKIFIEDSLSLFKELLFDMISNTNQNEFNNFLKQYENDEILSILKNYDFNDLVKDISYDVDINLLKKCFSRELLYNSSGVVIAGFNQEDMYPSYVSFNLFFNNDGKIYYIDSVSALNFSKGLILPFAQTDVVDMFLSGIDNSFKEILIIYFNNFIKNYLNILENKFIQYNDSDLFLKFLDDLRIINDNCINNLDNFIEKSKNNFYSSIFELVEFLPKGELIDMAESLIKITALKRKFDSEFETVGGNVNISIITKGDGFINIK